MTQPILESLPANTLVLPLGATVATALEHLLAEGRLRRDFLRQDGELVYLPHPSGANAESITLLTEWPEPDVEAYAERAHQRLQSGAHAGKVVLTV